MMKLLTEFLPMEESDLPAPYAEVEEDYNLADDRWIELHEAFQLAASEDDVIGIVE
jgi:hypothetical protein